jgi:deoxyadenosine/deoxycytidine kinase
MIPKNKGNDYVKSIISIQGSIGAGKSKFLSCLRNSNGKLTKIMGSPCFFVDEPVEKWKELNYENNTRSALDIFYKDLENKDYKFVLTFQIKAFTDRLLLLTNETSKLTEPSFCFCDRSFRSDKMFFDNLKDKITEFEYKTYSDFVPLICSQINLTEKIMIYIKCSPEICKERIIKRGNKEEKDISIEYLLSLEESHKKMIDEFKQSGGHVFEIDWTDKKEELDYENYMDEFLIDFEAFYGNIK